MSRNYSRNFSLDWVIVLLYVLLVVVGWLNIYGASYEFDQTSIFDFEHRAGKQFVWILTALGIGGILLLIDLKAYDTLAYLIYVAVILLLIITPLLAREIKGSKSWLQFGPISMQPAELAKVATALALAKFMNGYGYVIKSWRDLIIPFLIIGLPMLIIMIPQKEAGSALVFASFILMLYREGMHGTVLLIAAATVLFFVLAIKYGETPLPVGEGCIGILACSLIILLIAIAYLLLWQNKKREGLILAGGVTGIFAIATALSFFTVVDFDIVSIATVIASSLYIGAVALLQRVPKLWFLMLFAIGSISFSFSCNYIFEQVMEPHQQIRIKVLLGMEEDLAGAGYNVNQSKIAIGSGGFLGKGYLNGTQTKLRYVPEQDTDFIFCTVGEEHGFVGSVGLLLLYLFFLLRIITMAERQRDTFSRVYGYCVASIFFFHMMINIGMVIGILPVIGIPLPFISYGGSSLWGFTILLFIFIRLDASRLDKLR